MVEQLFLDGSHCWLLLVIGNYWSVRGGAEWEGLPLPPPRSQTKQLEDAMNGITSKLSNVQLANYKEGGGQSRAYNLMRYCFSFRLEQAE